MGRRRFGRRGPSTGADQELAVDYWGLGWIAPPLRGRGNPTGADQELTFHDWGFR